MAACLTSPCDLGLAGVPLPSVAHRGRRSGCWANGVVGAAIGYRPKLRARRSNSKWWRFGVYGRVPTSNPETHRVATCDCEFSGRPARNSGVVFCYTAALTIGAGIRFPNLKTRIAKRNYHSRRHCSNTPSHALSSPVQTLWSGVRTLTLALLNIDAVARSQRVTQWSRTGTP